MTTRLSSSSASTRAASRSIVVLPMPGRPMMRMDWPDSTRSLDDLDGAEDGPPDAAGEAHDLAVAVADGADAVQRALDAGAVVLAEGAHVVDDVLDVARLDLRSSRTSSPPPPKRASGLRPRSMTTSMMVLHLRQRPRMRVADLRWQGIEQGVRSSLDGWGQRSRTWGSPSVSGRSSEGWHQAGSSTRTSGLLEEQGDRGDGLHALLFEAVVDREFIGPHAGDDAVLVRAPRRNARRRCACR